LIAVATKDVHLARGRKIASEIEAVGIQDVATGTEEVILQRVCRRSVRAGDQSQECLRLGRQPRRRNNVSGERSAKSRTSRERGSTLRRGKRNWLAVGAQQQGRVPRIGGHVWVVNYPAQIAEVACALCRRWNTVRSRRANVAAKSLVIAEDEQSVLDDRRPRGSAKLIPVAFRNGHRFGKRVARKVRVRTLEIKCRSVQLVGSRLGLRRNHRTQRFAEFRIVILGGDLHFLDRIQVRVDNNNAQNRILVVGAIQFERGAGKLLALRQNLLRTLRVLAGSMVPAVHALIAR